MTTDSSYMNQTAMQIAKMAFDDDQNPFALQMYFHYSNEADLRNLLNWTDDETKWKPKTYPEDRSHYRLVAECMLRYYYYRFEESDTIHCDGVVNMMTEKFQREKDHWSKISIDNTSGTFHKEFAAVKYRKRRPRFFSRDVLNK
jgi:hypothetical protein